MKKSLKVIDNSFFHENYKGKRALILAPHEDDEINIAANIMRYFNQAGASVYVAFSTNGDYGTPAEYRIQDAMDSCTFFNVPNDNIFFLGYPDSYRSHDHLFYAEKEPFLSPRGYKETYGSEIKRDFAFVRRGEHSPYLMKNYHDDLKDLLLFIRADYIFCVDYDSHPDHIMLSMVFELVMGEILKENYGWFPDVFKRYAYANACAAEDDFFSVNFLASKKPRKELHDEFRFDLVDYCNYEWDKRIRFPVVEENRKKCIYKTDIYKALNKHKHQHLFKTAPRILNSDEIFWYRSTDNLVMIASVFATSGEADKINDFLYLWSSDIHTIPLCYDNYLWIPKKTDEKRQLIFRWDEPQTVSYIKVYGSLEDKGEIEKLRVEFDNGYTKEFGPVPGKGLPLEICIPEQTYVKWCKLEVLELKGENMGLSEVEFYKNQPYSNIKPYIKILLNDEFIYEWNISTRLVECKIGIYRFNYDKKIEIKTMDCHSKIENGKLFISKKDKRIRLYAYAEDDKIWDSCLIVRRTWLALYITLVVKNSEKV